MNPLKTRTWGEGETAVLVHGSISTGEECWEAQRPLAEQGFRLLVPDRRGYGETDRGAGEDFLRDAEDVAELLGDGGHLVGHSYGAVGALMAASERPEAVRSLAVIEPPAFGVADHPAVEELGSTIAGVMGRKDLDDRAFLESFLGAVGSPVEGIPEEMLTRWTDQVGPLRSGRPPGEAEIPIEALRAAPFPKLVVSGGHHPAFDAVCDALTQGLEADRVVITGGGHEVQMVAEPFNDALVSLWRQASGGNGAQTP